MSSTKGPLVSLESDLELWNAIDPVAAPRGAASVAAPAATKAAMASAQKRRSIDTLRTISADDRLDDRDHAGHRQARPG